MTYENAIPLSECSFGFKIRYFISFIIKTFILFSISISIFLLKKLFSDGSVNGMIFVGSVVLIWCIVYTIFYIITEGILMQMIAGFIVSIIGAILTFIFPPLGIVIAIIGFFMMVKQIIDIIKLIPLLILGFLLFLLIFDSEIIHYIFNEIVILPGIFININILSVPINNFLIESDINLQIADKIFISYPNIGYIFLSLIVSINLGFKYRLKDALFRQCVIFMAIPIAIIICILIMFIVESLADSLSNSLFQPSNIQSSSIHNGKIWIDSYMRNGKMVSGHFRSLPKI
ncbi:hypothetical protein [Brachyspira pilosicoli]|uniref:hypothetical protein n=1 Tax=Brachyspira pilosicoli TaxID=52584 RepID=UPI0030051DBF